MKFKHLYFLIFFLPFINLAQSPQVPKIVPATPQTAELTKYIDFPANLSLGHASTSIPIYTIQSSELTVPIGLSYDASGLKPNEDESGLIGLKWSLNAFGVVSRSINGNRDEIFTTSIIPTAQSFTALPNFCGPYQGTYNGTNYNYANQYQILEGISMNAQGTDTEPDIFSYKLPGGESNKFIFNRGTSINDFQAVLLKQSHTKVERNMTTGTINSFNITDTKGIVYRFGQNFNNANQQESSSKGVTSWLLTEMISPSKRDTIYFEYNDVQFYNGTSFIQYKKRYLTTNEVVVQSRNIVGPVGGPAGDSWNYSDNRYPIEYNYYQKKITKIRFKSGYVTFEYQFVNNECVLQFIKLFNQNNSLIKAVELKQSKFSNVASNELNWLKLDELIFYDNLWVDKQKYQFNYITGTFPKRSNNSSTFAIDHWGYYNGQNGNSSLIPNNIDLAWPEANLGALYGGNRSANGNYGKIGMLENITFPTKGTRTFTYEGNTSNNNPVGGIRISTITNQDGINAIVHTYNYGSGGVSKDISNKAYYRDYSLEFQNEIHSTRILNQNFSISSEPNFDIFINGAPVIYETVNEYIGTPNTNTGKITHYFSGLPSMSQNFAYPNCSIGPLGSGPPYDQQTYNFWQPIPVYYYHQYFPDVNETITEYRNVQNQIVKKEVNNYNFIIGNEVARGLKSKKVITLFYLPGGSNYSLNHFYFHDYRICPVQQQYYGSTTTEYINNSPAIVTNKSYTYNEYDIISSETSTNSFGVILKKEYKYATDLNGVEQSPYMSQLLATNRISEPIITKTYNGEVKTSETHSKYLVSLATNNILLPTEVHQNKGTNDINISTTTDRRIVYTKYGKWGNIIEYQPDNGVSTTILWDKEGVNPLAKIEGANFAQVITALGTNETAIQSITIVPSNLRTLLPNAMITTFTYIPLTGISTITDPKGYTTTYNYDGFGRLLNVKDANGKLLSENQYNYRP